MFVLRSTQMWIFLQLAALLVWKPVWGNDIVRIHHMEYDTAFIYNVISFPPLGQLFI